MKGTSEIVRHSHRLVVDSLLWSISAGLVVLALAACAGATATDRPTEEAAGKGGALTGQLAQDTPGGGAALTEQEALDAVWQALAPNTSSGDRANWQVVRVERVEGRDVADEFAGEPAPGCWKGPTPVPNGEIQASAGYWYVEMSPVPATPPPGPTLSPTAPPSIPEPFLRRALFLLDADGNAVARKLFCVVY